MAYDINAALERLERNLSEVQTAKKQVDETIATSESLQQIIERYVESLNNLNKEVSMFIKEVHNYHSSKTSELSAVVSKIKVSCDNVAAEFNANIKATTDTSFAKLSEVIVKINSENVRLATEIDKLIHQNDVLVQTAKKVNEADDKLDVLAEVLKKIQEVQDITQVNIKTLLDTVSISIKSHIDKEMSIVNSNALNLRTKTGEISSNISIIIPKLDNLISAQTEIIEQYNVINADLGNLKNAIDSRLTIMEKSIKTNRWIIIICLFTLIVLYFVKI